MLVSMNGIVYLKQYCENALAVKEQLQQENPTPVRVGEISQLKELLIEIERAEQIQRYTLS